MLEVSNRLLSHPAANVAAARPVNTSIALVCHYARRFLRSAPALLVVALWLSSQAFAQTTHRLRPETVAAPATTPCYGTCQVPVSCPSGSPTTVTGKVYVPNGVDPLPNTLVYIPSSQPAALTAGVQCLVAGTQASGNPVAETHSAVDGSFTLTNVPSGTNIPIVIQSGKWRYQGIIPTVTQCVNNVAPETATTMPTSHSVGDIPKIALVTGSVDSLECVLRKTGVPIRSSPTPAVRGKSTSIWAAARPVSRLTARLRAKKLS